MENRDSVPVPLALRADELSEQDVDMLFQLAESGDGRLRFRLGITPVKSIDKSHQKAPKLD
jgi:hypothetical protein